jgi:hypothetical protein
VWHCVNISVNYVKKTWWVYLYFSVINFGIRCIVYCKFSKCFTDLWITLYLFNVHRGCLHCCSAVSVMAQSDLFSIMAVIYIYTVSWSCNVQWVGDVIGLDWWKGYV